MAREVGGSRIGKLLTVVVAVVVVVAAMMWLSGYFRTGRIEPGVVVTPPSPAPATRPVTVERVSRGRYAEVVGSLQAEVRTAVSARLVANIVEMRVNAGDGVKRGQVLALLDDAAPKARVEQTKQLLRSAEANQRLAEIQVARLEGLVKANAASKSDLDDWSTRLAMAKADVDRGRQAIVEAESGLQDAVITAPFDGIVIDRQAEPGEQAAPGRALLTMYDPGKLRLEASVRESYVGRLKVGQELPVRVEAAATGGERKGVVSQIVPAADPGSRSFLVKVTLDGSSGLYPGMYGRMRLPLGNEEVVEIPRTAVREVGQVSLVDVVLDGTVTRRAVRLGRMTGDRVEILAGLEPGEKVVP